MRPSSAPLFRQFWSLMEADWQCVLVGWGRRRTCAHLGSLRVDTSAFPLRSRSLVRDWLSTSEGGVGFCRAAAPSVSGVAWQRGGTRWEKGWRWVDGRASQRGTGKGVAKDWGGGGGGLPRPEACPSCCCAGRRPPPVVPPAAAPCCLAAAAPGAPPAAPRCPRSAHGGREFSWESGMKGPQTHITVATWAPFRLTMQLIQRATR